MEILRYFMRYEEKYWGLFLVSLLFLYMLADTKYIADEKKGVLKVGAIYSMLAYLVFVCPITYKIFEKMGYNMSFYYILSAAWLLILWIPVAVAIAYEAIDRLYEKDDLDTKIKKKRGQISLLLGVVVLLAVCGQCAFVKLDKKPEVLGTYDADQVGAYELVIQDATTRGVENDMTIWGPYDWMAKGRIYDARITPIYGKDIVDETAAYDQPLRVLYRGFTAYEDEEALEINKDQQLSAIAYFMDAFMVAPCRYVAVFDPKEQGVNLDAKEIFETYGYEMVGQAGKIQVYRFLGRE